ncbi:hypothetical protein C0995_008992 [Termitomyces sp. Mi166|nr:hypothetical protein C0995_008992 [Termitomyces sp. Mi166\
MGSGEHKDKDHKDKDKDKKDKDKKDKDHKDKDKKDKDHKDKDKKDKDRKDKDKKDKDHKDKDKKDKKDKDKDKDKDKEEKHKEEHNVPGHGTPMGFPHSGHEQWSSPPLVPPSFEANHMGMPGLPPSVPPPFPNPEHGTSFPTAAPSFPSVPQPHTNQAAVAPPSGYRVPLTTTSPFPDAAVAGPPVCYDINGSPLYVGSALFENSVHPCKIGPHLQPFASVAYGGVERSHHGRFDLLPFVPQTMEWVHTSYGQIPPGKRPIEGGYEDNGAKLYHGLALVNGTKIPGKTSEHLGACNVSFGGAEVAITEYEILCWR